LVAGLASQSALAEDCPGHPDAIGTSRTLVVDPREHPRIGTMQYPETLPLRDHEVVLTFDDGPLPRNSNQVLQILVVKHGPKAPRPAITRHISPDPDNADAALLLLGIAVPNPARAEFGKERAQLLLEPWAVQAALRRRRGGHRLTDRERDEIRRCTRDPDCLRWPRGTDE
jgi:hypothetical protein